MRGHIRERSPGRWAIILEAHDATTGKRKRRWHSFAGTKRAAQVECARLINQRQTGAATDPNKTSTAAFLDRFERDWVPGNVAARTAIRYIELLKHVRRGIGTRSIQKLQPVDLAALYASLLRDGLAPRTVGHVHRVAHRALGIAKLWGVIRENVAASVQPPRVPETEVDILQPGQAQAVLIALRGKPLYPIAAMALATGMRRNEILALRWQDVDLEAARLRVEQSLEYTRTHGLRFKSPKTRHGRRMISLPPYFVDELRAHWRDQQEQRMALGIGKAPADSQVLATFDGRPRSPNAVTKEWTRAMATGRMPKVTLHSLRHTHASMLIRSGMDILRISRRLGHGSPTITLAIYGHLLDNSDDRATELMQSTFDFANGSKMVADPPPAGPATIKNIK